MCNWWLSCEDELKGYAVLQAPLFYREGPQRVVLAESPSPMGPVEVTGDDLAAAAAALEALRREAGIWPPEPRDEELQVLVSLIAIMRLRDILEPWAAGCRPVVRRRLTGDEIVNRWLEGKSPIDDVDMPVKTNLRQLVNRWWN